MSEPTSAVATTNKAGKGAELDALIAVNEVGGGLALKGLEDFHRFGQWVLENKMAPPCYETAGAIVVAAQTGAETGLTFMASVRAIYVVPGSGMPSWTSEAIRALIRRGHQDPFTHKITSVLMPGTDLEQGVFHDHPESGLKKDCVDTCYGWTRTYPKARNGEPAETRYSVGHAKQAGLWANEKRPGWKKNPERMLMHRSGAFHGRDYHGGILMGLLSQEEAVEVSLGSVPQLRSSAIDAEHTKPAPDPLFTPQEAISDAETVDVAPAVTEPPKEGSEGPLFDSEEMKASDAVGGEIVDDDPLGVMEVDDGIGPEPDYVGEIVDDDPLGVMEVDDGIGPEPDYVGDFCAEHLENPQDDCELCNEVRMGASE